MMCFTITEMTIQWDELFTYNFNRFHTSVESSLGNLIKRQTIYITNSDNWHIKSQWNSLLIPTTVTSLKVLFYFVTFLELSVLHALKTASLKDISLCFNLSLAVRECGGGCKWCCARRAAPRCSRRKVQRSPWRPLSGANEPLTLLADSEVSIFRDYLLFSGFSTLSWRHYGPEHHH